MTSKFTRSGLGRALAAASFLVLAAGTPTSAAEQVRVATLGSSGDLPMYLAQEKGWFAEEGIELEVIPFKSGAQMVAPLGTGQIDVAAGVVAAGLYNLSGRGVPFKLVSDRATLRPGFGYLRFLVRKELVDDGTFKTMADLKGMRLGTQSKGGAAESTLNEALKTAGLSYDDIAVNYLGHADLVAGLENGAIDAGFLSEPNATIALQNGKVVEIMRADEVDPNGILGIFAYSSDLIQDRPAVAEGFMRAYLKGCRLANDAYPDGQLVDGELGALVIEMYQSYMPLKDEAVLRTMVPSGCDPDGHLDIAKLQQSYDFFREQGHLTGDTTIADLLDASFAEKAAAAIGPYERDAD